MRTMRLQLRGSSAESTIMWVGAAFFLSAAATISPCPAETPTITGIGFISSSFKSSTAAQISADGSTVSGYAAFTAAENRAIRWSRLGGIQNLGPAASGGQFPLSTYAGGLSNDGSVVVGVNDCCNGQAFRWTSASGLVYFPKLPGGETYLASASALTGDGSRCVGQSSTNDGTRAVLWTGTTTVQSLGTLPGMRDSSASSITNDGSTIAGTCTDTTVVPAVSRAFRWTGAGGMTNLGVVAGFASSGAAGVSANGSVIVGTSHNGSNTTQHGFRWKSGSGIEDLGTLPPAAASSAIFVSADGYLISGSTYDSANPIIADRTRAVIWTPKTGFVDLAEYLVARGLDLSGWKLSSAGGVSADGRTLVGRGNHNGLPEGWVVTMAAQCPADLNNDDLVDDPDFVSFASAYDLFACADPAMPQWCPADLNLDSFVDDSDFVLFAAAYDVFVCP
ncbi:MAG: hypothetical protein KF691_13795 [Phycisphaeraceae bacterium]|nr:hypothetical protein [Phycisphaeraceae bacterium]